MGGVRLNSLAIIYIERHFANSVDTGMDAVIDTFAKRHGWKRKIFFDYVTLALE